MIQKYYKRSQYAAGAFFAGMILVIVLAMVSPQAPGQATDESWLAELARVVAIGLCMVGYFYGMWCYARAKAQSPAYGIILPFFGIFGLIGLLALTDRAADPDAAETELRKIENGPLAQRLRLICQAQWLGSAAARVVSAVMLIDATDSGHSSDFFTLLRWAVLITCAWTGFLSLKARPIWGWAFIVVAAFFQPFVPVHLERDTWENIDSVLGLALLVSLWFVPGAPSGRNAGVPLNNDDGIAG